MFVVSVEFTKFLTCYGLVEAEEAPLASRVTTFNIMMMMMIMRTTMTKSGMMMMRRMIMMINRVMR